MSRLSNCPTCDETLLGGHSLLGGEHRCPPRWACWIPDGGEDGPEDGGMVRAVTAEEAAISRAQRYDCGDYDLLNGSEIEVHVQPAEGGGRTRWLVQGETVPNYYARQLEPDA